MSNKSGTSSRVTYLPTGGALRRIGETIAPDLHARTGNSTVRVTLLPSRNGFQPHINQVYSTGKLTSPNNATGLFELDIQSEVLLPFEGIGIDTNWELVMRRAANLFATLPSPTS